MKKILTLLSLATANVLMGQALISDADLALLEKLKTSTIFNADLSATAGGIGSAQMLSLRGITKVGKFWYFSIYDASSNSCFWVRLKDEDRELALIKAEFFDDENKELKISTDSYTHILALKERDALTGPVPNLPGSTGTKTMSGRQKMDNMLSNMSGNQKAAMAMHLAASMMGDQNRGGQNGQMNGQQNRGNSSSGNRNSGNASSGNSNSSNRSSSGSSSGSSSSRSSSSSSSRSSSGGSSSSGGRR